MELSDDTWKKSSRMMGNVILELCLGELPIKLEGVEVRTSGNGWIGAITGESAFRGFFSIFHV